MKYADLQVLIRFLIIFLGETSVLEANLASFLELGSQFKIKGLTEKIKVEEETVERDDCNKPTEKSIKISNYDE